MIGEAVRAVLARDLGNDPVAVRAAVEEELRNRGIPADSNRVEHMTRLLVAAHGPFASVRVMRELWNLVGEGFRKIGESPEWLKPPPGRKVGIPTRGNTFEVREVELADGVQPLLTRAFDALYDPEYDDEEELIVTCKVWVDTRRLPDAGTPLSVILGSDLIGTLAGEDALVLRGEIRQAEKKAEPLILEAEISQEGDRFAVWVVVPPSD